MHLRASLTKFWAYSSMLLVTGIILFLFGYVFYRGMVLMLLLFLINSGITLLRSKLEQ